METPKSESAKRTVLIIEDQAAMRTSLCDFVQSAYPDFDIVDTENGALGMQLCRDLRPQLVLMDVRLPDANGIDLTLKVKAMLPETAVIIVSGHNGSVYIERALNNGALAYITKDKVFRELIPAISSALSAPLANQRFANPAPRRKQP